MKEASNHQGRYQGRTRSCNNPPLKVRLKDNRLYRRAFQLLALTSCQQHRKGSLIVGKARASRRRVGI